MKKYISLKDVEQAIVTLDKYKNEHSKEGELYFAMAIAVYIMQKNLHEVLTDLMCFDSEAKFDS